MATVLQKSGLPGLVFAAGLCLAWGTSTYVSQRLNALLEPQCALIHELPLIIFSFGCVFSILLTLTSYSWLKVREINTQLSTSHTLLDKANKKRNRMETDKQTLESALIQGQKLQAMGTLAGGIAHDFNNLLYAIAGYAEMARDDLPKKTVTHENIGKILEAVHRGQELVARILAFSTHHHHHKMARISAKDAIDGVLSLVKPTIPASVTITVTQTTPMTLLVNKTQFHQVLVNLITNAVDAMQDEGSIHIHVTPVLPGDDCLAAVSNLTPGPYCRIQVKDTGHGMEAGVMQRIFEPFYTTKEVGKGTGLGLSIAHTLLTEHHGAITVESELGQGTTFTLYLPDVSDLKE